MTPVNRIDLRDALDRVAPHLDPDALLLVRGQDLDHVAPHPEGAAHKVQIVPRILDLHESGEDLPPGDILPFAQREHEFAVPHRIPESVDRGHGGDDNHIPPFHEGGRRAEPQSIYVFIDGCIFLYESIRRGNIGLGLIIVVVGDEILDSIAGKELPQFSIQLSGERLVVAHDERRAIDLGNHRGQRHRLSAARHAQQCLPFVAAAHALGQLTNRGGLVAHRLEWKLKVEAGHGLGSAGHSMVRPLSPKDSFRSTEITPFTP